MGGIAYNEYMKTLLEFDYKKASQVINYFARKEGGKIDKMKVIKLIYLADRYHLRKYGRPIINDAYWAMEYGPVGSSVKDIADFSSFLSKEERNYAEQYIAPRSDLNSIASIAPGDHDVFSESDLEALEFTYKEFGNLNQFDLFKLTHKYPEWVKFESVLESKESSREYMSYLDFFMNPEIANDKFAIPEDELKASKDIFQDEYQIAAYWS